MILNEFVDVIPRASNLRYFESNRFTESQGTMTSLSSTVTEISETAGGLFSAACRDCRFNKHGPCGPHGPIASTGRNSAW